MIPCEVTKSFNGRAVGSKVDAPNQATADSWIADGLVKVVAKKIPAAPKDKVVRGSKDK